MDDGTERIGRGRTTIRDVARDAGVSVAAVSKVLRNAYGVSEALEKNVRHSIERLGYRPSTAARSLRGRTNTVGVLLVEMANPFLPLIVGGIGDALSAAKYKQMIGVGRAEEELETSLIESMIDFRMEGLILVAPRISGQLLDKYAVQVPMVVIAHHEPEARTFDTVNSDDRQGARVAVRALIEAGHRRIHMISLPGRPGLGMDVYNLRELGYADAMTEAGLFAEIRVTRVAERDDRADADLRALLSEPDQPTAIFCWSDLHAVRLFGVAGELGRRVPDDLAIVGYDNSTAAALPALSLSSMDQDGHRLGQLATEALLSRIAGRTQPLHLLHPARLVSRRSS